MVDSPAAKVAISGRRAGWLGCALAWMSVVFIETVSIPNEWLLVLLIPPFELALWLLAGWLSLRLLMRLHSRRVLLPVAVLAFVVLCVHFTNWAVFHPASYYLTH